MSLSKLQKLGYRYLESGEHPPKFADVIITPNGKKLYRKFQPKRTMISFDHIASPNKDAHIKQVKKQINWANRNYDQVSKLVNNLFDNNVGKYPMYQHEIQLPIDISWNFINQISPDALDTLISNKDDNTGFMFFGDVLSDKTLLSKVMELKATCPDKVILTAFAGPYEKLSYVFTSLPYEARVGKFLVSGMSSDRGISFNPHKLVLDNIISYDSKSNMMSFKKIKGNTDGK